MNKVKHIEYNITTDEEIITYYSDEEMAIIIEEERVRMLEQALIPTQDEVENAEFELKLLEKLIEWGVVL